MMHDTKTGLVQRFLRDNSGATAIEYALIAAGVGATVASTIWSVGAGVKANLYEKLANMF
jgi:pilus assembly protein Flp/PilA